MAIKTGAVARVKPPPEVRGTVKARRVNKLTDELELLLQWTEGDGHVVERWFDEDQLELPPVEAPERDGEAAAGNEEVAP